MSRIFITGDTHCDYDWRKINTRNFPEQKKLSKDDFVIIAGDFGGIWDVDRFRVQESPAEKAGLDWLEQKPFTTLFIPGNHENYDRLTGCRDDKLMNSWFYAKMPPEEKEKLKQRIMAMMNEANRFIDSPPFRFS